MSTAFQRTIDFLLFVGLMGFVVYQALTTQHLQHAVVNILGYRLYFRMRGSSLEMKTWQTGVFVKTVDAVDSDSMDVGSSENRGCLGGVPSRALFHQIDRIVPN